MKNFSEVLKAVRKASGLTQAGLAKRIGISKVLVAMVESGQKDPSKKLVVKLADAMGVHPSSIAPFIFVSEFGQPSKTERLLISFGMKMQEMLVKEKSKRLKKPVTDEGK